MAVYSRQSQRKWQQKLAVLQTDRYAPKSLPENLSWQARLETIRALAAVPVQATSNWQDAWPTVIYETIWKNPADGWAIASRGYARAMQSAGLDPRLISFSPDEAPEDVLAELGAMPLESIDSLPGWGVYVLSTTLGNHSEMEKKLSVLKHQRGVRVLYTTFERQAVDPRTIESLKELDGVWVPCTANARVLSLPNVRAFPHVFFPGDPLLALPPPRAEGPCTVYWIGRWEPRKAPHNLIRAFLLAFHPKDHVSLLLKLGSTPWHGDYPRPEVVIEAAVPGTAWTLTGAQSAISIVEGRLDRAELVALHRRGDIYASASRGEGWDLPSFEAKLAGRPVVTTASGGPLDFVDASDCVVRAIGSVPADPLYAWGSGATYIDYSLDELRGALRSAYASRGSSPPSIPDRLRNLSRFQSTEVGHALRAWFETMRR